MEIMCDKNGTAEINITIRCPECRTPMRTIPVNASMYAASAPWNENDKLTMIPTICPKCKLGGRIDINYP